MYQDPSNVDATQASEETVALVLATFSYVVTVFVTRMHDACSMRLKVDLCVNVGLVILYTRTGAFQTASLAFPGKAVDVSQLHSTVTRQTFVTIMPSACLTL